MLLAASSLSLSLVRSILCGPLAMAAAATSRVRLRATSRHWRHVHSRVFGLTPTQITLSEAASAFAHKEIEPFAASWDKNHHFPVDVLRSAGQLGFGSMFVPEEKGGVGATRADAAVVFETLARADISVTAYLTIHNMNCGLLAKFGSEALCEQYLPDLASLEALSSYCLTEPGSGSDAASLRTTARVDGDDLVIDGAKTFISGAGSADFYFVMARTDASVSKAKGITCILVPKDAAGLSFGKAEEKMGWNAQPTRAVSFDGVRVPVTNIVGEFGQGFPIAMTALDGGRINIAACSVGGASFCLDYAREYMDSREQFGAPVGSFQYNQFRFAEMATDVHASRLCVRAAANALDEGSSTATRDAAMAKLFATERCYDVANRALQCLGGYGYLREYPVERYVRDLRVHTILEGTNEVMRQIISKRM